MLVAHHSMFAMFATFTERNAEAFAEGEVPSFDALAL